MIDFLLVHSIDLAVICVAIGMSYIKCPKNVPSWFVWRPPKEYVRTYIVFMSVYLLIIGFFVGYSSAIQLLMMVLYMDAFIYILESRTWFKIEE